jgi:hypothetical protein
MRLSWESSGSRCGVLVEQDEIFVRQKMHAGDRLTFAYHLKYALLSR